MGHTEFGRNHFVPSSQMGPGQPQDPIPHLIHLLGQGPTNAAGPALLTSGSHLSIMILYVIAAKLTWQVPLLLVYKY